MERSAWCSFYDQLESKRFTHIKKELPVATTYTATVQLRLKVRALSLMLRYDANTQINKKKIVHRTKMDKGKTNNTRLEGTVDIYDMCVMCILHSRQQAVYALVLLISFYIGSRSNFSSVHLCDTFNTHTYAYDPIVGVGERKTQIQR